jgi:ABC-type transport system substrate-binding protein
VRLPILDRALFLSFLLPFAFAVAGCGGRGEWLRIGLSAFEPSLDITASSNLETKKIAVQVYEGLLELGQDGELIPGLARVWQWDSTSTRLTLRLRTGVRFHDGGLFTAAEAARSLREAMAGRTFERLGRPVGLETPDDSTLVIVLPRPHHPLPRTLASSTSVPMRGSGLLPGLGIRAGTGPFRPVRIDPAGRWVELERFPAYWGERPEAERLRFEAFSGAEAALDALEGGELDLLLSVSVGDISRILRSERLALVGGPAVVFAVIGMNNRRAPFDRVEVRRALAEAVDWPALVDRLYPGGSARPAAGFASRYLRPRVDSPPPPAFDPSGAAGRLLAALPAPQRVVRMLLPPAYSIQRRHWVENTLGPALAEAGLELVPVYAADFDDLNQRIAQGEWEISFDGAATENGDLHDFLFLLYAETNPAGGSGLFRMAGERVGRYLDEAAGASDEAAVLTAYQAALAEVAAQVPGVPFCELGVFAARSERVAPFVPGPYLFWRLDRVRRSDRP